MPSTAIRRFAYHPESRALDVTFVTGRRYRYFGVAGEVARGFREASSKGRFFNARIRDRFHFEELAREDD
jgi:lysyl-tRNA synthetase class 2